MIYKKHYLLTLLISVMAHSTGISQEIIQYKLLDTTKLFIEILYPEKMDTEKSYPAMVFYFGGGWVNGDRNHFRNHAEYFSKRGLVCFLVDYRTKNNNNTSPFESLKDAKSAMRFIRQHADDYGIDPDRIIASGGSAGGHLAAATALIDAFNEDSDDLAISCVPNALVLFNPVIDNGPGGYGYERIGDAYKDFSPLHNIQKDAPPTIIFLGTKDKLVPVETAEYYKVVMEKVHSRCDLKLYEGQGHGFFNTNNPEYYKKTLSEADKFLQSLAYLKTEPFVEIE